MKIITHALALFAVVALAACGGPSEYHLGIPSAADFEEPVPIRLAEIQIGVTGATGLGPDDRPMVALRVDAAHRHRIREDSEFVLRRERFGTGPLFVDVLPGEGEPVEAGHHFTARSADVAGQARDWWNDLMERTEDAEVKAQLRSLRARMDDLAAAGQERWDEARPELEAETRALLEELDAQSGQAADDLRRWWDEAVERAEDAAGRKKAN